MPIMGVMAKRKQPRPRRSFTPELKADVVRMVLAKDRTITEICRDLDLTETSVREWVKQAEIDAGDRAGLTSSEWEELAQLRRENRVLREERDLLKRATAFFAKEIR
jgi:transposase